MLPAASLLFLVLAGSAHAQTFPVGSGLVTTKETFKVGGGCDSFRGGGSVVVSVAANGSWTADAPAGTFSGTMSSADPRGRSWNLHFDLPSLALYELYLESAASYLCETTATITSGSIDAFVLKFDRDRTRISLKMKTTANGYTQYGSGSGKHQIKGKGSFSASP
jgi:hypothetical protein